MLVVAKGSANACAVSVNTLLFEVVTADRDQHIETDPYRVLGTGV